MPSRGQLNWDDLRVFLEVARQGHIAPAARRLKVDHATVSRRIGHLEDVLGVKLFNRTQFGMSLRETGRKLFKHAEAIEIHTLAAAEIAEAGNPRYAGPVRIAMMEGIASFYLAYRLDRLRSSHPDLKLELVSSPQTVNLTRRDADLFLSFFKPSGRGLIVQKIGAFELRLYASPAYLRRHGRPRSIDDLSNHIYVDYIDDLIAIDAVRWLADVVKYPKTVFNSNSVIAQYHAAVVGVGMALLPSFVAARDRRLKPILVGKVSVKRELWLSVHHDLHENPRARAVIDFITSVVAEDQDYLLGRST